MKIPRRHFLKGASALLPIPLLSSLLPRKARAQGVVAPRRILFQVNDSGSLHDEWAPVVPSGALSLPYLLGPLASVRDDVVVIAGVDNHVTHNHAGNAHDIGNGTLLTGVARTDFSALVGAPNGGGISIDQYLAGRLPAAPRRSINIDTPGGSFSIAYQGSQQPVTGMNLSSAFADLFGNFGGTTDPKVLARRRATRQSVIDSVLENFKQVQSRVGADDKRKLDHHLSTLRDLELRLTLEAQGTACATDPGAPKYRPGQSNVEFTGYLYALAFACQLSHVGLFSAAGPDSDPAFGVKFAGGDMHNWIHQGPDYGLDPVRRREDWRVTMRWYAQAFAQIITRLKATPDVDGRTLLDNTLVVWLNVFGNASSHQFHQLPIVMAGRAGGSIQTGRFLDYRGARAGNPTTFGPGYNRQSFVNETTNNLHVSLCKAMGLNDVTSFGDPSFCSGGLQALVG